MAAINDITGDALISKSNTEKFRSNYDKIFLKVEVVPVAEVYPLDRVIKSEVCTCTMTISILGEGCRHCQPQGHIDTLNHIITDLEEEIEELDQKLRDRPVWP